MDATIECKVEMSVSHNTSVHSTFHIEPFRAELVHQLQIGVVHCRCSKEIQYKTNESNRKEGRMERTENWLFPAVGEHIQTAVVAIQRQTEDELNGPRLGIQSSGWIQVMHQSIAVVHLRKDKHKQE